MTPMPQVTIEQTDLHGSAAGLHMLAQRMCVGCYIPRLEGFHVDDGVCCLKEVRGCAIH